MDNQTRNHLNLQKHIADQDHIIRVRNAEITALRKRAEKAEKERDDLRAQIEADSDVNYLLREDRDAWKAKAEKPRPLTPDAITDEMVERGARQTVEEVHDHWDSIPGRVRNNIRESVRGVLAAALTEPTRPEGAEELARLIATADVGEWDCGDLADALLATGRVRVVTEGEN